jgi:hypothetical protein
MSNYNSNSNNSNSNNHTSSKSHPVYNVIKYIFARTSY